MGEAALAAVTDVGGRALARQALGADVRASTNSIPPPPPDDKCGNNDAAERRHRPVAPPAAAGATEDQDARPPSRRRVGTPTRLVSLALLAGALALGPLAHADDHGDDRASATDVELPSETTGEIDPGDDEDWFRFEVTASGEVTAETAGGLDTIGALHDADGNVLEDDDDSGDAYNFRIRQTLDAGTYYLRVTSFGSDTGSYVLHLRRGSVVPAEPTVSDVTISRPASGDTFELAENIVVAVTFDREVALTGRLQLALTIGADTRHATANFPTSPTSWGHPIRFYYTVQPSDRDADGVSIGADALTLGSNGTIREVDSTTDAALGLGGHAISNSAGHKVDGSRETAPTVTRVSISNWPPPSNGDAYQLGEAINVYVYFDRRIDATAQVRLALTVGATVRQASPAFGRNTQGGSLLRLRYVVQPSDRDADGIGIGAGALTLNGGTIRIHRGNADASLSLGGHAISNSAAHKVDGSQQTVPTVRWISIGSPSDGDTYEVGERIWGSVVFDQDVEVAGEPQLEIQIGSATRQARFFRNVGGGPIFQYVVRPSDADEDGISVGASALKLNGGTIRSIGGTANAALDLGSHAIANSSNRKVDGSRETTAPTVTEVQIMSAPTGGDYSAGSEIVARVFFDRAVDVSGVPQLALTIGTATRQASHVEHLEYGNVARDAQALYFRYVVQPSDRDPDGIGIGADALSLNGGTITTQGSGTNAELEIGTDDVIDNDSIHRVNAGTTSADDHGDDLSSATRVALSSETAGAVDSADDADWFRFEVSARREVTVETSGGLDAVGTLYDLGGNVLAVDDDSGGGLNFRIQRTLSVGTYFVRVASFGSDTGSYMLRVEAAASGGATSAVRAHLRSLGDFDGDGNDDVLLRHDDGRWHFYPMDGGGVLDGSGAVSLTADLAWQVAGIGDFNGDGRADVLLRHKGGRWRFHPMDGSAVLDGAGAASLTADLAWQVAGIGDFDGDGNDDVLLRKTDGRWYFYPMDGRTVLAGRGTARLTADLAWRVAGVGDFDGDGNDDVLLRHDDGRWHVHPMDGRDVLAGSGEVSLTADLAWQVAGIGDFDGDGNDDVLLRHEDGRWHFHPMDGRAVRSGSGAVNLTADTATTVVGIGDLNGDGRADVLARGADGSWHYFALDGRRVLTASGAAALTGDLAWDALSGGGTAATTIGAPATGAPLPNPSLVLGQDEAIDLAEAFVDDQTLTYEVRSSDPDLVRATLAGDVLTLMPVAEGTATVTVTARDPDDNAATRTIAVTVGFRDCDECPLMVRIPAGAFTMGAPESEPHSRADERPQREVSIPAFAASAQEVTFAEWHACVGAGGCGGYSPDDEGWGRDNRPVVNVSWDDAQSYVDWLSRTSGRRYRLLTESEWEYAARAGTTTPFHTGWTITPQQANFDGRRDYPDNEYNGSGLYRRQTVPVGSFAPNGFGLYDMHGNVQEWVQDCHGDYAEAPNDGSAAEEGGGCPRVLRGGSWLFTPWGLRAAYRVRGTTGYRNVINGFRVARTL